MSRPVVITAFASVTVAAMFLGTLVVRAQPEPTATPDAAQARSPSDTARRAQVVVKIGQKVFTLGDIEDDIQRDAPMLVAQYRDPARLRSLVDEKVRLELLSAEAERRGLARDPAVMRAVNTTAVQALLHRELDEQYAPSTVPEADVRAYFDQHPNEFHTPELRRVSHIVVATREEATELRALLRDADQHRFREVARDRTLDTETRLRGGDLRFFAREPLPTDPPDVRVDERIVAAAFALSRVEELSEPIQLGERFAIVKLTGIRPEQTRTYEEAAYGIRMRLFREHRQRAHDAFLRTLEQRFPVERFESRLDPIDLSDVPPRSGIPVDFDQPAPPQTKAPARGYAAGEHR